MLQLHLLLSAFHPSLIKLVVIAVVILAIGAILRKLRQPYLIAYILAGVFMGESGLGLVTDKAFIAHLGEFGLILLLFFIGMETNLPRLLKKWKTAVWGTILQVLISVLLVAGLGYFYGWHSNRIIALGFIISLSSSAVVIKLLQDKNQSQSQLGQSVISILLMQDILIVPMLIFTSYLGNKAPETSEILLQLVGGILVVGAIIWAIKKKQLRLPVPDYFEEDHELQVFVSFIICFGCALITALFGLSAALGAFVGGVLIHATQSADWLHDSLHSFRVIFVAIFFVSVGMLIDLKFIQENWMIIAIFIPIVYVTNHLINTLVLRFFGSNWKNSWYGGAMLAQIGELSFVLAASCYKAHIIEEFSYQLTIVIISLTLLISPLWISLTKFLLQMAHTKRIKKSI